MIVPPNAASVAIIRDGRVLLIQRAFAPWRGAWSLPGGRAEAGESAEACAIREVREELGIVVEALRPVLTLEFPGSQFRLAVFATLTFRGEPVPSDEIAAWQWTNPGSMHGLETTPDLAEVLHRAFALFNPTLDA